MRARCSRLVVAATAALLVIAAAVACGLSTTSADRPRPPSAAELRAAIERTNTAERARVVATVRRRGLPPTEVRGVIWFRERRAELDVVDADGSATVRIDGDDVQVRVDRPGFEHTWLPMPSGTVGGLARLPVDDVTGDVDGRGFVRRLRWRAGDATIALALSGVEEGDRVRPPS